MSSEPIEQAMFARDLAGSAGPVDLTGQPHAPRDDEDFSRECHDGFRVADLRLLPPIELPERALVVSAQAHRHLDQERPKQGVAVLADASMPELFTGLHERRVETRITRHLFGIGEAVRISQTGPDRGRRQHADVRDRQQLSHFGDRVDARGDFALDDENLSFHRGGLAHRAGQNNAVPRGDRGQVAGGRGVVHVRVVAQEDPVPQADTFGLVDEATARPLQPIAVVQETPHFPHRQRWDPHGRQEVQRQRFRQPGGVDAVGMAFGPQTLHLASVGQEDLVDMGRKAIVGFEGTSGYLERHPAGPIYLVEQLGPAFLGVGESEVLYFLRVRRPFAAVHVLFVEV
jgi:hypothetical protein